MKKTVGYGQDPNSMYDMPDSGGDSYGSRGGGGANRGQQGGYSSGGGRGGPPPSRGAGLL